MTDAEITGVAVFLVYRDQLVLIQRDNNPEIAHPMSWGLPNGPHTPGADTGETAKSAAYACLQRKLSLHHSLVRLRHVRTGSNNEFFAGRLSEQAVRYALEPEPGEGIAVGLFTGKALREMIKQGVGGPLQVVPAVEKYIDLITRDLLL